MSSFIGRETQLNKLKQATTKQTASIIVIKGRRHIGKSRLAEEYSRNFKKAFLFSGLPPTKKITTEINGSIIQEVQKKIDTLDLPKGFSVRPILIHVNGVSEQVIAKQFFSQIIDFSELLDTSF